MTAGGHLCSDGVGGVTAITPDLRQRLWSQPHT